MLDFSAPPGLPEIDSLVQCACNILHQDIRNCLLIIYPKKYSGQSSQATLAASRRIEDMLLSCQSNFDVEIALHYNVDGMHANDKRNLSARARLCFSETVTTEAIPSPWMQSIASRGKINDIPLLRIKEMKRLLQPGSHTDCVEAWNLSPAERTQHKGSKAALRILEALLEGVATSPSTRLDVVELQQVAVPDWMEGCWQARQAWQTRGDKPAIHYAGFSRELAIQKTIQGHLEAILMDEFWNRSPEAGPAEPTNGSPVDKPVLSLASWDSDSPCLSDVVVNKFDGDEVYSSRWNGKVADFRQFIANVINPLVQRPITAADSGASGTSSMAGPDFSVEPSLPTIDVAMFTAVPKAEFKMDDVLLACSNKQVFLFSPGVFSVCLVFFLFLYMFRKTHGGSIPPYIYIYFNPYIYLSTPLPINGSVQLSIELSTLFILCFDPSILSTLSTVSIL